MIHRGVEKRPLVLVMLMSRNDSESLCSNSCVNWMLGCFELR